MGRDGYVDFLYTDYRRLRQGIARRLYRRVEAQSRKRGARRLLTEASITARPFFERMGFEVMRAQRVQLRGVQFRNYAMQKELRLD